MYDIKKIISIYDCAKYSQNHPLGNKVLDLQYILIYSFRINTNFLTIIMECKLGQ